MACLLFPGRHHLLTNFQLQYLTLALNGNPKALVDVNGAPLELAEPIDTVIWPITSANHFNTRRNPLPADRREAAIEDFARELDADSFVYLIDDVGTTPRFAEYVLKKIDVESRGRFRLTPANTVVGCSTPAVIELYERLGFRILPVELSSRAPLTFAAETPWELLERLVRIGLDGKDWRTDAGFLTKVARATRRLFLKYNYGDLVIDLYRRPLLTADGDLTATRDYNTYVRSFDQGAERKYAQVRDFIVPGRIADIGCCTGSVLRAMTLDDQLRESDFYGIEAARPLYVECLHRKEQHHFANDNVFFYQGDFVGARLFAPNSVNTFTTFSLTHEIESYQGRSALQGFLPLLHEQLALGGRWINLDVVGPENKDEPVFLWLNGADGHDDDAAMVFDPNERERQRAYLEGLSTLGRFQRFARDFRREEGYQLEYQLEAIDGQTYGRLRLQDAGEFLSKKDYTDNWQSEMHETFCFWSFTDWQVAVTEAGFRIVSGSRAFTNEWLVTHRYQGKAELYCQRGSRLERRAYPATHLLLIAEKV